MEYVVLEFWKCPLNFTDSRSPCSKIEKAISAVPSVSNGAANLFYLFTLLNIFDRMKYDILEIVLFSAS